MATYNPFMLRPGSVAPGGQGPSQVQTATPGNPVPLVGEGWAKEGLFRNSPNAMRTADGKIINATPEDLAEYERWVEEYQRRYDAEHGGFGYQLGQVVGDIGPLLAAAGLGALAGGAFAPGAAAGGAATEPAAAGWVTGAGESLGGGLGSGMGLGGAGAAGVGGVGGAGAALPGSGGLVPGLLDPAAYLDPIAGGLASGGSVVPGAAGAGAIAGATGPFLPDVFSPFFGSTVGGVAPELGGTGSIVGDSFGDIIRRVTESVTGSGGGAGGLGSLADWILPAIGAIGGGLSTPEGGIEMELPWNYQDLQRLSGEAWDVYGRTNTPSADEMAWYDQYMGSLGGAQNAVNTGLSRADQDYYDTYRPSDQMMGWYDQYMGGLGNAMGELNNTLAGNYLTPDNPLYKSIFDDVTSRMGSMFYSADMTGPMQSRSAFAPTYSKEMSGQLAANLFNPERNRMMEAANMMPGLGTAGMGATDFMENYGTRATDRYNQQVKGLAPLTPVLGEAGQRASNFMAMRPWQAFGNLANTIKPYGQFSPYPAGNTAANALGGLFGGLALNNLFT